MNSGGIRIEKLSVRLRGVTAQQARDRAGAIAREIAGAVAREGSSMPSGKREIGKLSVRVRADGKGNEITDQIRRQLAGERPRE